MKDPKMELSLFTVLHISYDALIPKKDSAYQFVVYLVYLNNIHASLF